MSRFQQCLKYVCSLKVEPLLLLYAIGFAVKEISYQQLVQDKMCLQDFAQSREFCQHINDEQPIDETGNNLGFLVSFDILTDKNRSVIIDEKIKSEILANVTLYIVYKALIAAIPSLLWALFAGSFIDKHPRSRKYIMASTCFGGILESIFLLANSVVFDGNVIYTLLGFIPGSFFGSISVLIMAVLSHMTAMVSEEGRNVRFAIAQTCAFIGLPLGTYVGGDILTMAPVGKRGQLFNYEWVFGFSLISQGVALIWILLTPLEVENTEEQKKSEPVQFIVQVNNEVLNGDCQNTNPKLDALPNGENAIEHLSSEYVVTAKNDSNVREERQFENSKQYLIQPSTFRTYLNDAFNIGNVKDMIKCCVRVRPNDGRKRIWFLLAGLVCVSIVDNSTIAVFFQFVQKAYKWDAKKYSLINAVTAFGSALVVAIAVVLFTKGFKWSNNTASWISCSLTAVAYLLRGTIYKEEIGYLAYVIGALQMVPLITSRSELSLMIDKEESGKMFCLVSTFDALVPTFAAVIFGVIFSTTIDIYLGLAFLIAAAFLITALIIFIWLSIVGRKYRKNSETS